MIAPINLLVFISSIIFGGVAFAQSTDRTIVVRQDDAAMEEAKRKGRATLAEFLALARAPRPSQSNFAVKIGIGPKGRLEFVWVRPFERRDNGYVGRLRNDVQSGAKLKYGDVVAFEESDIVDWSYRDGDVTRGNFTGCVALRRLPKAEALSIQKQNALDCQI